MAGSIATAYVQVMPSMEGIKGKLEQEFSAEGIKGGNSFGSKLAATAIKAIAAAKVGETLWNTLTTGAQLEQNLGGAQAVFGDFADSINKSAQKAYQTMGLTESEYLSTANKMASLFQGSGMTQQRSMEMTTQAMQRAADVASVMGIDMSQAMDAVTGAAKGNFEMMDNLGVAMNVATLEAYALEKGINFKWNTASQAQKSELAMEMFFDRTSQYAGNFKREATETFSGAFESMRAAAKNVTANMSLGEDIKPALRELVSTTKVFLMGNFLPAVKNVISHVPDVIRELGGSVADAILGVFGTDLETVMGELDGIFAPLKQSLSNLFSTVSETVRPLIEAFREYVSSGEAVADVTNVIKPAIEGLVAVLSTVVNWIAQFINWLNSGSTGAKLFKAAVVGIAVAFGTWKVVSTVTPIIKTAIETIKATVTAVRSAISIFKALGGVFAVAKSTIAGMGGVLGIIKAAIAALGGPVTLTIAAVAGLAAGLIYLWNTSEGFRNAITTAWDAIVTSIKNAIAGAKESFAQFVAGLQMITDGAALVWADITAGAARVKDAFVGYFTNTIPAATQATVESNRQMQMQIATVFNNIIANAISWVADFTNKAWEAAQGFASRLVNGGLMQLPAAMAEIGAAIVEGIWAGISAGWEWLTSAVSNLANSLLEAAKSALGINSPSKVFRDGIGRWIPAGIAQGIRAYSGLVTDAITDLTAETTSEFTAALRVNTSQSGSGNWENEPGARVVNLVQNIYSQAQTAADQARENRYQMEMAVLLGV